MVVVDDEWLAGLEDPSGGAAAALEAKPDPGGEDTGADLDFQRRLVAVGQVQVAVGRADESTGAVDDRLEQLVEVEPLSIRQADGLEAASSSRSSGTDDGARTGREWVAKRRQKVTEAYRMRGEAVDRRGLPRSRVAPEVTRGVLRGRTDQVAAASSGSLTARPERSGHGHPLIGSRRVARSADDANDNRRRTAAQQAIW